jgi:hypothetical protein
MYDSSELIENIGKRLENGLLSEIKLSIIIVKSYRKNRIRLYS